MRFWDVIPKEFHPEIGPIIEECERATPGFRFAESDAKVVVLLIWLTREVTKLRAQANTPEEP